MKLWMSGEIQSDVADAYMRARKQVAAALNGDWAMRNYGASVSELAYIAIIRAIDSPDYNEVKRFSKRDRTAEFRLKIPHPMFVKARDDECTALVAESVLRAVRLMRQLGIKDFDHEALEADVVALMRAKGWV